MARVHVQSWRETYRGLMGDAVLDDPAFELRRERFWAAALTDPRYTRNRTAVAVTEQSGQIVGISMAQPADATSPWAVELNVLYLLAGFHGSGAGSELLAAVVDPGASAALWVADPNPRAQAFYAKHGFRQDGTSTIDDGVRTLRMVRGLASLGA